LKLEYHISNLAKPEYIKALAQEVLNAAHLMGQFTLRSGRVSSVYFDKYLLFSNPQLLYKITKDMADMVPPGQHVIIGREMGTVPLAVMLSQHTGAECGFLRKEAKKYGTQKLVEGAAIKGKKVLVLENSVTSGGEVMTTVGKLRGLGAIVTHALVLIDQEQGAGELLSLGGVKLLSLLKRSDFKGLKPNQ
jgi:orotate phosphoribosyltransferase